MLKHVISLQQFGLKIHTPERIYFIQTANEQDMRQWSKAINMARKKLKDIYSGQRDTLVVQPFPEFDWSNIRKATRKVLVPKPVEEVCIA